MIDIQISGFEMLSKLGQGGMATVWKARQISLDRIVAIKILSSRLASDPDDTQRFQKEAQSAAKLKHPGIVQVYDANIENGLYYFVMEFVAGYTCADWQERKGHLGEKDVLLIADCVADALAYAWEREQMIHCDIKPDNIMIDDDGTVKVTDLGLARTISTMTSEASDEILGTPAYMAPEQALGEPGLDCRTDMYSLGAMLYHLATGTLLFAECEPEEVMERQIKDFVPNPRDLNSSLSKGFCRLVEVMMAKEQAGRPHDWKQVQEAIKRIRKGLMPTLHLPEGIASTVLPAKSNDDIVLHRQAGAAVAAHGLRADEKTSKVPLTILAVLLAVVAAAYFLLDFGGGGSPSHDIPAAPPGVMAIGTQQDESQDELRAHQFYDRAVAWERRHPAEFDGAIARYREVVSECQGSRYAERANRDIERVGAAKRENAIAGVLASLNREADRFIADRNYDSAIRSHEEYAGDFAQETRSARMDRVAELQRAKAEWEARERIRIEQEKQAKIDALLDAVAVACIEGDFAAGAQRLERALADAILSRRADEFRDLFGLLTSAAQIESDIIDSFVRQQGQHVTVELVSGSRSLLINGARGDVIFASTVMHIRGGTASTASNFMLKDLAVSERIKRMGSDSQPHVNLVKGVMALALDSFDHAQRFFSSTDVLIASRLQALVEERQSRAGVVVTHALGELMRAAGLTPATEFDKARWVAAVQAAALSSVQADSLRHAAALFHQEHQGRSGYDQVADVVSALMSVQAARAEVSRPRTVPVDLPNVVLPDDIAGLVGNPDAVMDRLLADNGSLGSENVEMRRDHQGRVVGIRIRSNTIGNISALAALRDLRSFELRAGGGNDTAPLADISALAGMPLETVVIEGAAVENLRPLQGLPIRTLRVPRTGVRDLSMLRGMMLESVDFSGTRVFDFTPLSSMPITSFAANNSQLRQMGFMRDWQLESLEIADTSVFDFSILSRMPLKRLLIANTQVRVLDVLGNCPLEELDISGSAVRDLSPLRNNAATLRQLKMDRLPVKSFDVFRFLNLNVLSMQNTEFNNLRLVSHMQLADLTVSRTPLATLDGLDTSRLSHLNIEGTKVTSIHQLQDAGALRRLFVRDTGIRNFTPIYNSGITHLFIDDPDNKIGVFGRLPSLAFVNWQAWAGR